jgi:hypothetical protein
MPKVGEIDRWPNILKKASMKGSPAARSRGIKKRPAKRNEPPKVSLDVE